MAHPAPLNIHAAHFTAYIAQRSRDVTRWCSLLHKELSSQERRKMVPVCAGDRRPITAGGSGNSRCIPS